MDGPEPDRIMDGTRREGTGLGSRPALIRRLLLSKLGCRLGGRRGGSAAWSEPEEPEKGEGTDVSLLGLDEPQRAEGGGEKGGAPNESMSGFDFDFLRAGLKLILPEPTVTSGAELTLEKGRELPVRGGEVEEERGTWQGRWEGGGGVCVVVLLCVI